MAESKKESWWSSSQTRRRTKNPCWCFAALCSWWMLREATLGLRRLKMKPLMCCRCLALDQSIGGMKWLIEGILATGRPKDNPKSSLNHGGLQPFAICLLFQHVSDVSSPQKRDANLWGPPCLAAIFSSQHQPTVPKDSAKAPAFAAFGAGVATQHHSRCSELRAALRATVGAAHLVALGRWCGTPRQQRTDDELREVERF